jgi:uncharacterized protein
MRTVTIAEWLQDTPDGVSLAVKVIPRAGVTKIAGTREGRLLIRLAAAPVDGAANDALVAFLSGILKVTPKHIRVIAGARSRHKLVAIEGMTAAQAAGAISPAAGRA